MQVKQENSYNESKRVARVMQKDTEEWVTKGDNAGNKKKKENP